MEKSSTGKKTGSYSDSQIACLGEEDLFLRFILHNCKEYTIRYLLMFCIELEVNKYE